MTDIVKLDENKDIIFSGFKLSSNGLKPVGKPTYDQWASVGEFIRKSEGAIHFWLGDWFNYGEENWGEAHSQELEDKYGYDFNTLSKDKWVANKIDPERRHSGLSFRHHEEVACLPPEEQSQLLCKAEEENINSNDFRRVVKKFKKDKKSLNQKPTGNFDLIYVDTPILSCYPEEMVFNKISLIDLEDIKLPLNDDSLIFIWSTGTNIANTIKLMTTWGFKQESMLVWNRVKTSFETEFSTEHCLFLIVGVKGMFTVPSCNKPFTEIIETDTGHKPEKFFSIIEKAYPEFKKAIIGNIKRDGWLLLDY